MLQIITFVVFVGCVFLAFFTKPIYAWITIFVFAIYLLITLWSVRRSYRYKYLKELSYEANDLLEKYWHYFAAPFGCRDYSASAATSQFGGVAVAIACMIQGFWLAVAFAIINWFIMGYVAISFSPIAIVRKDQKLQIAYNEIVDFFANQIGQK